MVATDLSHVQITSWGGAEQEIGRPELVKKSALSLKIGSPSVAHDNASTLPGGGIGSDIMTPSASPAATPPTGPAPPGLEFSVPEPPMGSGAMAGPAFFQHVSKRHKKDKHIKELKGGLPPLNVYDILDVAGGSESDTPERTDESDSTPERRADGSDSDSEQSEAAAAADSADSADSER